MENKFNTEAINKEVENELMEQLDNLSFADILEEVMPCVVGREYGNFLKEKGVIVEDYSDDMSIYYCFPITVNNESAIIKLNEYILEMFDITVEQVKKHANDNLCESEFYLSNMQSVIMSLMTDTENTDKLCINDDELPELYDGEIYVLSNKDNYHGSSVLLTPFISYLANTTSQGIYIIPSSIHEVLIVTNNEDMDIDTLSEMVCSVNPTLEPHDVLSEKVIYVAPSCNIATA